ncbi:MAG: ATP synthase F1 subunit epsilon [Halothiobacillaceae bacterium]
MAMTIKVDVVALGRPIYSGIATFVVVPTEMGDIGITPLHAQTLSKLRPGEVVITTDKGEKLRFYVGFGVVEVQPYEISVLADWALTEEDAKTIDPKELEDEMSDKEKYIAEYEQRGVTDFTAAQLIMVEAAERLRWIREHSRSTKPGARH